MDIKDSLINKININSRVNDFLFRRVVLKIGFYRYRTVEVRAI